MNTLYEYKVLSQSKLGMFLNRQVSRGAKQIKQPGCFSSIEAKEYKKALKKNVDKGYFLSK